jgi:hypothetical protein
MNRNHSWRRLGRNSWRGLATISRASRPVLVGIETLAARLEALAEALKKLENLKRPPAPAYLDASPAAPPRSELPPSSVVATERIRLETTAAPQRSAQLGWLPILAVTAAVGVTVCTIGNALSRSTRSSSQLPFWVGLLIILVPIIYRICSAEARRGERVSLVILLGFALYLVKIVLDPFGFTFGDELLHATNANAILRTHELFHTNSLLPVSAYYPGLESVTDALASMTGLSSFGAGLIVVGAARLVIMLALYLLFERLSGSSRVAALGAAIYTANANFLFWSAQFSYESLALPLLVVVLFGVTEFSFGASRAGWSIAILLVTLAIVATHHLSSYALVISLTALCLAYLAIARDRIAQAPWPFALFALVATVAWLTFVASATVGYLTPIFSNALVSTIHTVSGEAAPRELFGSSASGPQAPALERIVGVTSVMLMVIGFPFGLRIVWRRYRRDPLVLVLAVGAAGFFGTLALRFAPGAWEIGNRASEFLFVGLGFVLALVGLDRWSPSRVPWLGRALTVVCVAVVFSGGVIAGWKPELRLSQPYRIKAGSHVIDVEGRQMARWAAAALPPYQRIVGSESDTYLLGAYANQRPVAGHKFYAVDLLQTTTIGRFERFILRNGRFDYIVVDRRLKSFDNMNGYYFGFRPGAGAPDALLPADVALRFDTIKADRLYDSGNVVVYDLKGRQ